MEPVITSHQSSSYSLSLEHDPASTNTIVAYPQMFPSPRSLTRTSAVGIPYFPDYFRYKEWEREFDTKYVNGSEDLPALSLVRLMNDHTGNFGTAIDGVNTPELQQADNDYAVGLLVEKVSKSKYADNTLIFIIEDDAPGWSGPCRFTPQHRLCGGCVCQTGCIGFLKLQHSQFPAYY